MSFEPSWMKTPRHDTYPEIDPRTTLKGTLDGQVALITGASRGVGQAVALAFAQAGASKLILTARTVSQLDDTEKLIKDAFPQTSILKVQTDVSKRADVERLFSEAKSKFGTIHVLVNNAGVAATPGPVAAADPEEWWKTYEINNFGVFLTVRAFLQQLPPHTEGVPLPTIINTTSSMAVSPGMPMYIDYQSSKIANTKFSEALAAENPNVRIFAFHPGNIATAGASALVPPEQHAFTFKDTVELAAHYTVYLVNPRADYLRGRHISANWDVTESEAQKDVIVQNDTLKFRLYVG